MSQQTAREERVQVGDVSLFTRQAGDGPEVVVLHGGPGAHHDYLLPQMDLLADGRCLRYYDQRGGGQSAVDADVDVGWQTHVEDLRRLLDFWRVERATILGYSWGGLLALLFAIAHNDRLEKLALVSPAPNNASSRDTFHANFAKRSSDAAILEARQHLKDSGLRESDPVAYRRRAFELSVAGYFASLDNVVGLSPFRVTGRTQTAVWESLDQYDLRDQLRDVRVRAHVFHGRHDPIPLAAAADTATLLQAPLTIFEHSGHVPYVEETETFVSAVGRFL